MQKVLEHIRKINGLLHRSQLLPIALLAEMYFTLFRAVNLRVMHSGFIVATVFAFHG